MAVGFPQSRTTGKEKNMRKSIIVAVLVLLAIPVSVLAIGQARMTGKVVDTQGNPIPDATITLKHERTKTFEETFKVKKDGSFALAVVDGTIEYDFTVSAPGYPDYKETIKMQLVPEKNEREFVLGTQGGGPQAVFEERGTDPASMAFNEGAALFNESDLAGAIAKFDEAVTLNPDLAAGWVALAKANYQVENWQKAVDSGEKALEIIIEDDEIHSILSQSYEKLGNTAKAEEYKNKLPDNAGVLYNDAVEHLNAGDDAAAEPLLKRAVKADGAFAPAHFQLGMVYVRMGKNAEAKTHLQKYLDLEPDGSDAPMAKEIIKYLQ
jgi:tetratricopeptide (TPR) repeat protein